MKINVELVDLDSSTLTLLPMEMELVKLATTLV